MHLLADLLLANAFVLIGLALRIHLADGDRAARESAAEPKSLPVPVPRFFGTPAQIAAQIRAAYPRPSGTAPATEEAA